MVVKFIDGIKKALEENCKMQFKLYVKKSKKNNRHNQFIMDVLSVYQDGDIMCVEKFNDYAIFEIDRDYMEKIVEWYEENK